MHIFLALIYVSLVVAPGCSSLPIREDIQDIVNIAKTTLVHISMLRNMLSEGPTIETSTPSIDGLNSISYDLALLDNELKSVPTKLHKQVQYDVSSMEGRVRSLLRTMNCSIQERPSGGTNDNSFPDTKLQVILNKVESYMGKFLHNSSKLEVC